RRGLYRSRSASPPIARTPAHPLRLDVGPMCLPVPVGAFDRGLPLRDRPVSGARSRRESVILARSERRPGGGGSRGLVLGVDAPIRPVRAEWTGRRGGRSGLAISPSDVIP